MKLPFILFAIASVTSDPTEAEEATATSTSTVQAEPEPLEDDQCEHLSSSRLGCDMNAINKDTACGTNFEELLTCYKFAKEDCEEVTKSVCTVPRCCFNEFISEVECHTGCQVECGDTTTITIERTAQTVYTPEFVHMPEVCLNLPPDDIKDDNVDVDESKDDSEEHSNFRDKSGAFTAQYTMALCISVMICFLIQFGERSLNWSATAFLVLGMLPVFLVLN